MLYVLLKTLQVRLTLFLQARKIRKLEWEIRKILKIQDLVAKKYVHRFSSP